ncbi:hypothetical protein BD410DRAFT_6873 [Rickenella mellea]|uniref:Uncharacterized protein n=1 Tax=Rickenella mellea TaxID=50990 RepID=A0A4R5XDM8_9AGAM|nr:hypothetical protein BD410DRAFT_6873 [Rickenella mellea]
MQGSVTRTPSSFVARLRRRHAYGLVTLCHMTVSYTNSHSIHLFKCKFRLPSACWTPYRCQLKRSRHIIMLLSYFYHLQPTASTSPRKIILGRILLKAEICLTLKCDAESEYPYSLYSASKSDACHTFRIVRADMDIIELKPSSSMVHSSRSIGE